MPPSNSIADPALMKLLQMPIRCAVCSLHERCLPTGSDDSSAEQFDRIVARRRRVHRGDALYRVGDRFSSLYAIRVGHFKTSQLSSSGVQQITGFQMAGELLGLDAIAGNRHQCDATALEDSEVCEVPFSRLEELCARQPALLHHFHRMMSHEIARDQRSILLLGNMRSDQRLAAFLVSLSVRYLSRGYSSTSFQLRMSREEIGNALGLSNESISRVLSEFKKQGWVEINHRHVELRDLASLRTLSGN